MGVDVGCSADHTGNTQAVALLRCMYLERVLCAALRIFVCGIHFGMGASRTFTHGVPAGAWWLSLRCGCMTRSQAVAIYNSLSPRREGICEVCMACKSRTNLTCNDIVRDYPVPSKQPVMGQTHLISKQGSPCRADRG